MHEPKPRLPISSHLSPRERQDDGNGRPSRLVALVLAAIVGCIGLAQMATAQSPADPTPADPTPADPTPTASAPAGPSAEALEQIEALVAEKRGRTLVQHKIASQLLIESSLRHGALATQLSADFRSGVEVENDGTVLLDVQATVTTELLERVELLGGEVVSASERYSALRIHLPLEEIEALASSPAVRQIHPALPMLVQMINTTEGDVAHGADTARATFAVDGTGVLACAMSDSVEALASLQGSGDLPAGVTVLPGQAGAGTSEGTALLEILHDMAPGADLAFATGQGGEAQMAQNILDLAALGCDVIVDDVLYLGEAVFQDGIVAQAVDQVAAGGVLYFTSAGNSGNLNDGESGVWEGDYLATALPASLTGAGVSAHDFGGGDNANEITTDGPAFFTLQWADPQGGATNDYDLYLLDSTLANVLGASTSTQNGTQNPLEAIDTQAGDDSGNHLVVVQFAGLPRFLHLNTHRGRLETGTDGQIFGHPGALGSITLAAVDVSTAAGGKFTGGPANPVEFFSSDGPRRIFFDAAGQPLFSAGSIVGDPVSEVRQKPELAAADGVSTATPGFNPFFGTSASAPHAAAIAALLTEYQSALSPDAIREILFQSALDIEDPGFDRDSGFGIIDADEALNAPIFADGFESGNTSSWTSD